MVPEVTAGIFWRFPEMGDPHYGWFIWENPMDDDWGIPHCRKPPYGGFLEWGYPRNRPLIVTYFVDSPL